MISPDFGQNLKAFRNRFIARFSNAIKSSPLAASEKTRILAISVDAFDDLLDHDPDFARRVLELESRQLQRFVRSIQPQPPLN